MVTWYWAAEYSKVLAGYIFLMFIWPLFMLRKYLKGRSTVFCFSFCITFQPVLVNTAVLLLGLVHLLNPWIFRGLFYIPFLIEVWKWLGWGKKEGRNLKHLLNGTYGIKLFCHNGLCGAGRRIRGFFRMVRARLHGHWWEYGLLFVVIVYGMIYFSWGAFQDYSYGFGDMYTHHSWIYGLIQGQIFSAGVYPEGVHCFIYGLHVLFGIRVYSIMLFLQPVHVAIFLLSVYILLKEVFHWKYTPIFALAAFLTIDVVCIDAVYSMSRLQWMLPQEFGLYTPFLCAAFLIRYLGTEKRMAFRGKLTKGYWDENLLVFALSLCASLTIHFYPTIMAFFLCLAFVPLHMRKIFSGKRLIPLAAAAVAGIVVAVLPMGGALASGIEFQGSIGWAMSVIDGTDGQPQEAPEPVETAAPEGAASSSEGGVPGAEALPDGGANASEQGVQQGASGQEGEAVPQEPKEPLSDRVKRILAGIGPALQRKALAMYKAGYETLYRQDRAVWIIGATALAFAIWLLLRFILTLAGLLFRKKKISRAGFDGYFSIALASVIFMGMYCANSIGLPSLIAGSRLCTTIQMLILAMMLVPVDLVFTALQLMICEGILKVVSAFVTAGIYVGTILTGNFHGFLYYELTRFNGAVLCTDSIISTLPRYSYTIVSPVDELYQMIQYGWHEELLNFVNESQTEEYRVPAEHLFIFVEKTPIEYAQSHFFTGPEWLACERYPEYYNSYVSQCPGITTSRLLGEEEMTGSRYQFELRASVYSILGVRTLVESLAYKWCQKFDTLYPGELQTYYEDEHFVCYYIKQNPQSLYQLGILYQGEEE